MFGADYAKGRMVTGVSLSHSRGLGRYAGVDSGQVNSAVTGLYPWIGYKASERVTVWTVAGYGAGGLMLNPGAGAPIETGLSMAMAAGGGRGQILGGGEGFGLAFKADTLWVGMRTKAVTGPGGNLDSTTAAVSRLRTALEGSQSMTIAKRMALTPSVEIGIRQDGGDAETGRGMDLGAGLVLADGVTGLAVDIRVRRLLVHQAAGFAESGMSISVSYNPTPFTPLGLTARVSPAWGGESMSGAEALWGRESMAGMSHDPLMNGGGQRLDTEMGYGVPIGSRFVGTPRAGVRTSEYGRDYRIGYGMQVLEQGRLKLQLGVDAERRERVRSSTCKSRAEGPTSASSGAQPCSGSTIERTRPKRPLTHPGPGAGRPKGTAGARSKITATRCGREHQPAVTATGTSAEPCRPCGGRRQIAWRSR